MQCQPTLGKGCGEAIRQAFIRDDRIEPFEAAHD
jgi:hypothetical protein